MSNFNADSFLATAVSQPMKTKRTLLPAGDYTAVISEVTAFGGTSDEGGDWVRLSVRWTVTEGPLADRMVYQSVFVTLTPEGAIDGQAEDNWRLGKLREAVDQNGPEAWTPANLNGSVATIKVKHKDGGEEYGVQENVSAVTHI